MLTLYHAPLSPCAQKVRLVLHEKQLPYQGMVLDLTRKENLAPDYLALNPNGVVPTLVDDGLTIIESSIICEYLDDRFPEHALRPDDPALLARMRLWAKRVDDKIHPACGVVLFGAFVRRSFLHLDTQARAEMLAQLPDPVRRERQADLIENGLDSPRLPAAVETLRRMADDIDKIVSGAPWMLGNTLSIADFLVTPYVWVLHALGLERVFSARPALADWFARIQQTRGYRQGLAAFDSPRDIAQRAALLPSITPKLEPHF